MRAQYRIYVIGELPSDLKERISEVEYASAYLGDVYLVKQYRCRGWAVYNGGDKQERISAAG